MPVGLGSLDAEGIYQFGESDIEGLASDLFNLGQESVSTQFGVDRARLTALEAVITPHTEVKQRFVANTNTFTNTNTTYTDLPNATDKAALDLSFVKQHATTKLVLRVDVQLELTSGTAGGLLQVAIDIAGTTYLVAQRYPQATATRFNFSGMAVVTGLAAGTKAIKPRIRYTGIASSSVQLLAGGGDYLMYSVEETE